MIDLILFCFVLGVYAGGFWCGKTYGSFGAMFEKIGAWVSEKTSAR